MTVPQNPTLWASPYGASPVVEYAGPEGGPYTSRAPQTVALLTATPRTATTQTAVQSNYAYRGLYLFLQISVNPGGAQTLAVELRAYDLALGFLATLLTVPASATPGGLWLVYPGASGAAVEGVALTRNAALPAYWYALVTHSGVGAWTYSVTGILLP